MRSHPTEKNESVLRAWRLRFGPALLACMMALAPMEAVVAKEPARKEARAPAKNNVSPRKTATPRKAVAKKPVPSRKKAVARSSSKRAVVKARPSAPQLQLVDGKPLLKSSVAYVVDQETGQVLLGKNDEDVRPIASITKLMTGIIVADAGLPLDERITITSEDVDRLKGSGSRLRVGTELTRRQALHLTLMSSENRAAHALARTYPGGERAFVDAMNNMARKLGMDQTRYVEPTGLSSNNRSSARDLAVLVAAAAERPLLAHYSTSRGYQLATDTGRLRYVNSNPLVRGGEWRIGLQKTGYIREAGQCVVMQAQLAGRELIVVLLDSANKVTRVADAERVRRWLAGNPEVLRQVAANSSVGS